MSPDQEAIRIGGDLEGLPHNRVKLSVYEDLDRMQKSMRDFNSKISTKIDNIYNDT